MSQGYKVSLVARNEGIDYCDESGVYRFNVGLKDEVWTVYLPGSKGASYRACELSEVERSIILPRIKQYLEERKSWGIIGRSFPVVFERREWAQHS
jgi:hypothetical protein